MDLVMIYFLSRTVSSKCFYVVSCAANNLNIPLLLQIVASVNSSPKECYCTIIGVCVAAFLCVCQVSVGSDVTVVLMCFDPEGHKMCESV